MKSLLHLLFVLSMASTSLAGHPLTDAAGNPILNDAGKYYISPVFRSSALIQLVRTGSETCPRSLVQPPVGIGGVPLRFSSHLGVEYISTSMRVHVDALPPPELQYFCLASPARWKVEEDGSVKIEEKGEDDDDDDGSVKKIVEKGEQNEHVGPFRIEAINRRDFKLQYCEDQNDESCKDIGVSSDDGRLIVNDGHPLKVRFVRISDYNEDGSLISIV